MIKSMAASSPLSSFLSPKPIPSSTPVPPLSLSLPSSSSWRPPFPLKHSQTVPFREALAPILRQRPSNHDPLPSDLLSVACPSLAFANIVYFKSGNYNVQVIVGENEDEEKLVSRFRRGVLRAGIIQESKRRRFFETSQEKRKRKIRDAAKRNRRRRPPPKSPKDKQQEALKKEGYREEDDNWDFHDGDLPYCEPNP